MQKLIFLDFFSKKIMITNMAATKYLCMKAIENNKYECECGSVVSRNWRAGHLQTNKHLKYVAEKEAVVVRTTEQCVCGSILFKINKAHLKSKKHLHFIENAAAAKDCAICYEKRLDFFQCDTCHQEHCLECNGRIEKCPFCRASFVDTPPLFASPTPSPNRRRQAYSPQRYPSPNRRRPAYSPPQRYSPSPNHVWRRPVRNIARN